MSNFPTSLDDSSSLPNPSATDKTNSPSHADLHGDENDAIRAIEAKVGIGATTPTANSLLFGTGTGTSRWGGVSSAEMLAAVSDETGTGSLVFANTPTLNTPKIDTISENTSGNGVTVDGLSIKDGKLNTNDSVTTSNITDGAIDTDTIAESAVTAEKIDFASIEESTSVENVVGTWVDGSLIYRKVFTGNVTASASARAIASGTISNLKDIIRAYGYMNRGTNDAITVPSTWGPSTGAPTNFVGVQKTSTGFNLISTVDTARTSQAYAVAIEYTKTV